MPRGRGHVERESREVQVVVGMWAATWMSFASLHIIIVGIDVLCSKGILPMQYSETWGETHFNNQFLCLLSEGWRGLSRKTLVVKWKGGSLKGTFLEA
jgi:hypothetical protein